MKSDAERLQSIEKRVRDTICPTWMNGEGPIIQGRILESDFNDLLSMLGSVRSAERERCAALHESINPASDQERFEGHPGAGAMGAVIEYRDAIRALP